MILDNNIGNCRYCQAQPKLKLNKAGLVLEDYIKGRRPQ